MIDKIELVKYWSDKHKKYKTCSANSRFCETLHTCPYLEEIHNDHKSLCDCDDNAAYQCAQDI
jgi:GTP-dependent phosphoenolpyruvate carboxykinase